MNYNEVSQELVRLGMQSGKPVWSIAEPGLRTTAVYIIPSAWLIAFEPTGALLLGGYQGQDLRLMGTHQILFADLTLEIIRREFNAGFERMPGD
jgi:hypothetical protein